MDKLLLFNVTALINTIIAGQRKQHGVLFPLNPTNILRSVLPSSPHEYVEAVDIQVVAECKLKSRDAGRSGIGIILYEA
ncbi:hypothetical protein NPX13_g5457 [Xylaria arbuscula]|uniref:Uncharacterized protein n=1 Tax=Xylaria arbuscula TaxID=114810 RepID=A0A9W8NEJ2_9PEZI|nr:hypothetical protein NPX13_g5457 [Xylaria arbuscula]